ncbi:MAG: PAS domain-containing protein [Bacteroidota bacterium]
MKANKNVKKRLRQHKSSADTLRAEDALQNNENFQRSLLENFPFAIWMKDTESRFLAVNTQFAKMFSVATPDELVGKTDFDITTPNIAEAYRAHDRAVLESRQKNITEEEVIGLGEHKWFEAYKAPMIGKDDELLGTIGFLHDITARKQAEQALVDAMTERENLIEELQSALDNVKILQGLLPICGNCKKIRDDKGFWNQVEGYIQDHTDATFTHGICPECYEKLYGDILKRR